MRRVVVLPQPDGPRSVANEPLGTSNETSSTAAALPNRLVIWETRRCTAALAGEAGLATRHPQREAPARERGEDDEGRDRHRDVGDGERGRAAPVEIVHELVDAYRGDGRRGSEEEDDDRQRRDRAHERRHEADAQRATEQGSHDVPEATELKTSVLRSASPLDPVTTKVKCRAVGARLIGKSTVRAETRSVP